MNIIRLSRWFFSHDIIDIYYNIRRIISWIPILWKDRNFDYSYLYIIMQFKISHMRKRAECNITTTSMRDAKYMKICEKLLDILIKEDNICYKYNYLYLNKCKRLLFNILDTQLHGWWD